MAASIVFSFVAEKVPDRIRLASVIGDVEGLVLDEVAPGTPLAGERAFQFSPLSLRGGGFVDAGHFGKNLGRVQGNLKWRLDLACVVPKPVVEEWALKRKQTQVGPIAAAAESPDRLPIRHVPGQFADAEQSRVRALPKVFRGQAFEGDRELAVSLVPSIDQSGKR